MSGPNVGKRTVWRNAIGKGGVTVRLELEVDEAALLDRLGDKAIRSSRGESRIASGLVKVSVRRLK
jgi:hypothetical protein